MQAKFSVDHFDFTFSDNDVVNPSDFIPTGEFNPHNVRPWLLHDHGFTVAVVFADCLQNALDEAADNGKLDRYALTTDQIEEYGPEGEGISYLGNASESFDIESLQAIEIPAPAFSFAAMFMAGLVGQASQSEQAKQASQEAILKEQFRLLGSHAVGSWSEAGDKLREIIHRLQPGRVVYGTGEPIKETHLLVTTMDAWSGEGMGYRLTYYPEGERYEAPRHFGSIRIGA